MTPDHPASRRRGGSEPQGSVFGYDIVSDIGFTYLRQPTGGMAMTIREKPIATGRETPVLREWEAIPGKRNRTLLRSVGEQTLVEVGDSHRFLVDADCSAIEASPTTTPLRREMLLFGTPAAFCMTRRGDLAVHGSAVDIDGRSLLFAAPGRHGKTTLAAGFAAHGFRVLSDDLTCVDPHRSAINPGPAVLRVRQDVAHKLGPLPDTRVVYEDDAKVHYALEGAGRGTGSAVPMAAIVLLRSDDDVVVERHDPVEAVRDLWAVSFSVGSREAEFACFQGLTDLVARVPVWILSRPMRLETMTEVIEALRREVAGT